MVGDLYKQLQSVTLRPTSFCERRLHLMFQLCTGKEDPFYQVRDKVFGVELFQSISGVV